MKGVSPVIETVLMAAAIVVFLIYFMGAFNDFTVRVASERTRMALVIDSQKVVHAILLARREVGAGESKFYVELADVPSTMEVRDGRLITSTRAMTVNTSLYNMDSYVTFTGEIVNTKGKKPYIASSGDTITLGVE
jgi:outer membrane receptor for monomeric catechols